MDRAAQARDAREPRPGHEANRGGDRATGTGAARARLCLGDRVLRRSRERGTHGGERPRVGFSRAGRARMGGRGTGGPSAKRAAAFRSCAESARRRAREDASGVSPVGGRPAGIRRAVDELDRAARSRARDPVRDRLERDERCGECGRAAAGDERRIHGDARTGAAKAGRDAGSGDGVARAVRRDGRPDDACEPTREASAARAGRIPVRVPRARGSAPA